MALDNHEQDMVYAATTSINGENDPLEDAIAVSQPNIWSYSGGICLKTMSQPPNGYFVPSNLEWIAELDLYIYNF